MTLAKLPTMCVLLVATSITGSAQLAPPAREIPLYPGVAPGSEKWNYSEKTAGTADKPQAQNIVRPVLLYYPAPKAKAVGTAMIVAPGGGFRTLMMSYEGVDVAKRLNEMGVDAFVLKYRTIYVGPDAPAAGRGPATTGPQAGQNVREMAGADGQQAIRLVRQHAAEYGVAANRIGIIGYSAGGAVVLSTVYGPAHGRPNFAAPIYAAGANSNPPPEGAPPLFIAVAADDQTVGYQGSIDLFGAWRKAGLPAELHVFQTGQHGFVKKGGGADQYLDRALQEKSARKGVYLASKTTKDPMQSEARCLSKRHPAGALVSTASSPRFGAPPGWSAA
jgi:acetyl esterase/lipase